MDNHELITSDKTQFGFWVYIMTDLIMFASLFAAYAVLRNNTFGSPAGQDFFNLQFVLAETILLLTSSFTAGIGMIAVRAGKVSATVTWFTVTLCLGITFLVMELSEFSHLFREGITYQKSAFLSAFFTLVGTHGLHIFFGCLWMAIMLIQLTRRGLTVSNIRKMTNLSLY